MAKFICPLWAAQNNPIKTGDIAPNGYNVFVFDRPELEYAFIYRDAGAEIPVCTKDFVNFKQVVNHSPGQTMMFERGKSIGGEDIGTKPPFFSLHLNAAYMNRATGIDDKVHYPPVWVTNNGKDFRALTIPSDRRAYPITPSKGYGYIYTYKKMNIYEYGLLPSYESGQGIGLSTAALDFGYILASNKMTMSDCVCASDGINGFIGQGSGRSPYLTFYNSMGTYAGESNLYLVSAYCDLPFKGKFFAVGYTDQDGGPFLFQTTDGLLYTKVPGVLITGDAITLIQGIPRISSVLISAGLQHELVKV